MPNVVLDDATPEQLMALGDAALRMGRPRLALSLYMSGAADRPLASADYSRIGLAQAGTQTSQKLLEVLTRALEISPNVFVGDGLATWSKATPFIEDARFMALAVKHAHLLPVINWHWNLQTVLWAARQALDVEGEFMELGVYKGHTTAFVAEYLGFQDRPKTWFLYDTFDGIPDDQVDEGWAAKNEANYRGERMASFDKVTAQFAAFPNIQVIRGPGARGAGRTSHARQDRLPAHGPEQRHRRGGRARRPLRPDFTRRDHRLRRLWLGGREPPARGRRRLVRQARPFHPAPADRPGAVLQTLTCSGPGWC